MKNWAILLFAAAALGAATAVVGVTLRRQQQQATELDELPEIISDCFSRIQQIERDLRHLRPEAEGAG